MASESLLLILLAQLCDFLAQNLLHGSVIVGRLWAILSFALLFRVPKAMDLRACFNLAEFCQEVILVSVEFLVQVVDALAD